MWFIKIQTCADNSVKGQKGEKGGIAAKYI